MMKTAIPSRGWVGCAVALAALLLAGCASAPEQDPRARYRLSDEAFRAADAAPPVRFTADSTFDDYLQQALSHSPKLRAAFGRWQAALERIPQARSLDDPELSFEYYLEQIEGRYQVSLKQLFPAFGKLALMDRRAAAEAEAAMYQFEAERFDLFEQVVKAFYDYQYLSRATAVTEETLRLVAGLEESVTARYKTGLAPFSGLLKVQSEKDRIVAELAAMNDERTAQSSLLSARLNLPPGDPLPWPKQQSSGPALIDETVLAGMIDFLNPQLKAADAMIDAGRCQVSLARRRFVPDLMLGANWMVMPGMGGKGDEYDVGLMAGISVPLWVGKNFAAIREAEAGLRTAGNEKADGLNMLRAELSMAVARFRDAERKLSLYNGALVPRAEQALEAVSREFSSGQSDFMALIDAHRTLLEFRLMSERAAADREIALGVIGCCIGKFDVSEPSAQEPNGVVP